MMMPDQVVERRSAGIFLTAGLAALWLSYFPLGVASLLLRVGAFVGIAISMRRGADPDSAPRRKVASVLLVVAFVLQVQNFFLNATLSVESAQSDLLKFFVGDHAVPVLVCVSLLVFPHDARRRSETALLWTAVGLAAFTFLMAVPRGMGMMANGASQQDYRTAVAFLRTLTFAPSIAASIMLLVPPREVLTEEEAFRRVEQLQAQTRASLRQAVAALEEAASPPDQEAARPVDGAPSVTPSANAGQDILTLLEGRLARGEISEATYLRLRGKYGDQS